MPLPSSTASSSTERAPRRRPRLASWAPAAAVFVLGAIVTLAVFAGTRERERVAHRLEFERRAANIALSATSSFDVPLEVLRSVPAFFEASEHVTRAEFRDFTRGALARYPWIYALEWIPRIPAGERTRYEAEARADGLSEFEFKQDAPSGPPVRADPRPEYLTLYYMEPPNPVALGLEETALPVRRAAIERARDLGETVVTARLKLVQDEPSVVSVIAFHPVYRRGEHPRTVEARRESLRGLAAAVFRVRPVLDRALSRVDADRLDVLLVDVDAEPHALLYESRMGAANESAARGGDTWEHLTTIAGRTWAVRVVDRDDWVNAASAGGFRLGVGLLVSLLAAALAFAVEAAVRLRQQVHAARRLGPYTLVERLGEGGMGTVYRAHHSLLRRPTAIKLLHATRGDAKALARFESEVQRTSSLTHPNTIVVYDYGRSPDGVFYYAMEYIDGITLQELVDSDGPQPAARVVHILSQVCASLAEAHGIGLVHRDIKPANIMLCRRGELTDFVKVLDFGLAKDLSEDGRTDLSRSAVLIGTPLYLAPEVALQHPIDARADIYALGAVAYFMLTGTPVFEGKTVLELCFKHLSTPPDPLSERLGRSVPPELEQIVLRCLSKDPADRPATVEELAASLHSLGLSGWTPEIMQRWWTEHGQAIEHRVQAARKRAQPEPYGHTLEVRRRNEGPHQQRADAAP